MALLLRLRRSATVTAAAVAANKSSRGAWTVATSVRVAPQLLAAVRPLSTATTTTTPTTAAEAPAAAPPTLEVPPQQVECRAAIEAIAGMPPAAHQDWKNAIDNVNRLDASLRALVRARPDVRWAGLAPLDVTMVHPSEPALTVLAARRLMRTIIEHATSETQTTMPRDATQTSWLMDKLGNWRVPGEELCTILEKQVLANGLEFVSNEATGRLLWCYTVLRQEPNAEFLDIVTKAVGSRYTTMSINVLAWIAWSSTMLNILDRSVALETVNRLLKIPQIPQHHAVTTMVHQVCCDWALLRQDPQFVELFPEVRKRADTTLEKVGTSTSTIQKLLARAVNQRWLPCELEAIDPTSGLRIDLVVPKHNLAVEVLGPVHYFPDTNVRSRSTVFRNRVLALNWKTATVPWKEVDNIRAQYNGNTREKLLAALVAGKVGEKIAPIPLRQRKPQAETTQSPAATVSAPAPA